MKLKNKKSISLRLNVFFMVVLFVLFFFCGNFFNSFFEDKISFSQSFLNTVITFCGTLAGFIFAGISILLTVTEKRFGKALIKNGHMKKVISGMILTVMLFLYTAFVSFVAILINTNTFYFLIIITFLYSVFRFLCELVFMKVAISSTLDNEKTLIIKDENNI